MDMGVIIVALLFFTIHSVHAEARDWWDTLSVTPERPVGLLDLHDVVRGGCGEPVERTTARVFRTPAENGDVGRLYWQHSTDAVCGLMFENAQGDKEGVPTLESGYEVPAAIVYERRGSWFRIRLPNGSSWIRRTDPEEFLPYPDLLRENLAHMLPGWDGTLRETPNMSGKIRPLAPGWHELLERQPTLAGVVPKLVDHPMPFVVRHAHQGRRGDRAGLAPLGAPDAVVVPAISSVVVRPAHIDLLALAQRAA